MHLLEFGVDISLIALWLGHESIETTHIYIEADLAIKERSLAKLTPAEGTIPRFKAADSVLAFLDSLWSPSRGVDIRLRAARALSRWVHFT